MGLKARQWSGNKRIKEAATVPFRSLHTGQFQDADMGEPVKILSETLKFIELHSHQLPTRLLPHPNGPNGPPGIQWGPYDIPIGAESFSDRLAIAVAKFQKQAGDLDIDGKAGRQTFARLDEFMVFFENMPPS
jgi:hypothetical protein